MDIINEMVETIVKSGEDHKGQDITVLDIREDTTIADYFIIISGNSSTQVRGIGQGIEKDMEEKGFEKSNASGYENPNWVIIDYEDVVLHVFHREEREFYNIERLWEDMEKNQED